MKKLRLIAIALSLGALSQVHASAPIKLFEKSQVAAINLDWNQVIEIPSLLNKAVIDEGQYLRSGVANFYQRENERHSDEPQAWAMGMLGVGFVVYQLRRRKRVGATWNLH